MSWIRMQSLKSWRGYAELHVGQDKDGDIGILDERNYSIIIRKDQAEDLREWLDRFIEQRKPKPETK